MVLVAEALGVEPRALSTLSKHCVHGPNPCPCFTFHFEAESGQVAQAGLELVTLLFQSLQVLESQGNISIL